MSKLQPIWQHLPSHFKRDIVSNLDYISRNHLRICSSIEKNLVDSCHVSVDFLSLSLSEPVFRGITDPRKPAEISINDKKFLFSKNFEEDDVIEHFINFFSNPINSVITLKIHVWGLHRNSQQFKFFKKLLTEIHRKNLKLRVQKLEMATIFPDKNQLLTLMQSFDVVHLVSISLDRVTSCQLGELSQTEQWKKVKEIKFETRHEINADWISHLDQLKCRVKRLSGDVISDIIKNFLERNPPHLASFSISTIFPIINSRITLHKILQNFPEPVESEKATTTAILHSQKIKMADPNNVLFVVLLANNLGGIVCKLADFEQVSKQFIHRVMHFSF